MRRIPSLILILTLIIIGLYADPSFTAGWPNFLSVAPPSTFSGNGENGTIRTITGVLPSDFKENEQENIGFGPFSNRIFCKENNVDRYHIYIWLSGDLLNASTGKTLPSSSLQYIVTYINGSGETNSYNYKIYVPFTTSQNTDWAYYSKMGEGGTGGAGSGMEREV